MNSIVERLRWPTPALKEHAKIAADLIEQQAARIAELEAELASMAQGVKISIPTQTMEQEFQSHYRRGYEAGQAALRKRIDDAPVVAWRCPEYGDFSKVDRVGWMPLISKEDLK